MNDIWSFLLQTLTASGVAALLLILKAMFRDKLSPRWQFAAWGVLAVVLLLPAGRGGRYALLNWPFYVELLRSVLTGEYGALAHVTAPVPLPAFSVPRTAAEWLFAVYALGVVFFLVRYIVAYIRLRLVLRGGHFIENGQVQAVAEQYNLPVCPVVEVDGLLSAFICGPFRPILALPAGVETDEKVILHELLHLKYRDAAWGLVICFFRCLHWCNPLLWYCADQAGNDLESLCDQRVLERLEGEARRDYGRILLKMADEKYARAPGTSSMANGGKNIRRRIEAIARFKKYPAGMKMVSVCILLVLAMPLAVGTKARLWLDRTGYKEIDLAHGRTVPCTTYAGAFDTYAKAVLTGRSDYRAMCAPLANQNELAEQWAPIPENWLWPAIRWKDMVDSSSGYQIYNLVRVEEKAYEGMLALELSRAPLGTEDDDTGRAWLAVRTVRAEKERDRWVVRPQEDWRVVRSQQYHLNPLAYNGVMPVQTYEAQWGDFTFRREWQSGCSVEHYGTGNPFVTTPRPDGIFETFYTSGMTAIYTGAPEDKGRYQSASMSSMPVWGDGERPKLRHPGPVNSSGGSSTGEEWEGIFLKGDWDSELFFGGGGSQRDGYIEPPSRYAMDFYLNGKKEAELTLFPVEGGTSP